MDRVILALGVLIAACAASSSSVPPTQPSSNRDPSAALGSFLASSSKKVIDEYMAIVGQRNITKAQEREKLLAWAKKNNFTEYKESLVALDKHQEESRKNFAAFLRKVASVYDDYVKIEKDSKLTKSEISEKFHELRMKNIKEYNAMMHLLRYVDTKELLKLLQSHRRRQDGPVIQKMKAPRRQGKVKKTVMN